MKPITLTSVVFAAATQFLGVLAATATSSAPTQTPSTLPVQNELTSHGCYSSGGNFTKENSVDHVSSGICGDYCTDKGFYVMGLHGSTCYCGYVYPPEDDVAADSKCNYPCPGYGLEACGGINGDYYSVFNTGVEVAVDNYEPPVSSTSSAASKPTTSTTSIESSVATESAEPTETSAPKKKSTNTAAIAAGVVVGVVAVAAGIGAFFFFIRRRRNAEIEEEHRRNAAVNAFINGSKPPSSSGSISMTDSRLDPVMAHRRLSDGSIADNQDYSRRILRVTNA